MRKTEKTVYFFDELPEDVRQKAIENLYDINVDCEWWEFVYEDAEQVGIKLTAFDIDRASYCKGVFIDSPEETAQKIIDSHGEKCETYKTAKDYLENRTELVKRFSDGITLDIVSEDNEWDFDQECDDLDKDFLQSILEDYRIILSKEYDYLTSEESIIETIKANEYEFDESGKIA